MRFGAESFHGDWSLFFSDSRHFLRSIFRTMRKKNEIHYSFIVFEGRECKMKYFATFLPMKDPEKSKTYRQEHLDYLAKMREKKRILLYGRFVDGAGGLVIYQGESLEKVAEWVKEDPYVKLGARGYEIHEWDMQTDYKISESHI